jgi:hypothetical protein
MAPSDEELQRLTGISDLDTAASTDMLLIQAWMAAGFTRQEAFALLLTIKTTHISVHMTKEE